MLVCRVWLLYACECRCPWKPETWGPLELELEVL